MDPFDLMAARLTAPPATAAPERRPQVAPRGMPGARALVAELTAHADRWRRQHHDVQLMRRLDAAQPAVTFVIRAWPDGAATIHAEITDGRLGRVLLADLGLSALGEDDEHDAAE